MSLGEDTPGILGLLLLISWLGRLQNLICNTLVSVVVSGLVLSLGLKNANAIQEAFEFARPEPVLLMMMRSFYHFDRTVQFSLLVMALR
jgi:predicted benzoate:H+ symporter BenE